MPDPEIVWLASWPRSGNTLLRAILWHCFGLRSGSLFDETWTIDTPEIRESVGCATGKGVITKSGLVLAKTHRADTDTARAIYILRDGREACVSSWHFIREVRGYPACTLEEAIRGYDPGFGSWSEHVENWSPDTRPGTLLLRYEDDLLGNLPYTLHQLGVFLQRKTIAKTLPGFDHFHKLYPAFFRSGKLDSWRDEMKGDDLKLFWDLHGETMEKYGYGNSDSETAESARRRAVLYAAGAKGNAMVSR